MDKDKAYQLRVYNLFKHWLFYEGYVEKKNCSKTKFIEGVKKLTGWSKCITKKSAYSYMYRFMQEVYPDDLVSIESECSKMSYEKLPSVEAPNDFLIPF